MTTNNLPEELHLEILKHLSPSPKVLARASAVCREWRRVLNDPAFLLELYRTRRGAPVTQGYFDNLPLRFVHVNAGDPVRIPLDSIDHRTNWQFVDCRHGRVLLRDRSGLQFMVWQPMTGDQHFVQDKGSCGIQNSVALICECAAEGGDDGPKVGQAKPCHASHFRVVVVSNHVGTGPLHGVVFSSVTRLWSESAELPPTYQIRPEPSVVVGRMIYQPLFDYHILAFDTDKLRLATFERPKWDNVRLLNVDGDVLGLVGALGFTLRLWVRYADAWVMRNTIDLSNIHPPLSTAPLPKTNPRFALMPPVKIIGVADGGDELFLWTMIGVFMLSVESMELKKVNGTTIHHMKTVYPYGAFYIPPSTVHPKIAT
uniref:Uncharacterized protein n=1 Tax=Avena sativa TaxID=4498 RepID=A0ACD5WKV8_AVESA